MLQMEREELLRKLESVGAGLARKENVQQSTCFAFRNGTVSTFNQEVACRAVSPFGADFTGALPAAKLLNQLRMMPDKELKIEFKPASVNFVGKQKRYKSRKEAEVEQPVDNVEVPTEWKPLPDEFADAIATVGACSSESEQDEEWKQLVHIHNEWVESGTDWQICRWAVQTPVTEPVLVKSPPLRQAVQLGMIEFADTEAWLHLRNKSGLIYSIRRYHLGGPYPDITGHFQVEGESVQLPKSLVERTDAAGDLSAENGDGNYVKIKVGDGRLTMVGSGISGEYETFVPFPCRRRFEFMIDPKLLKSIVEKHTNCVLSDDRLMVAGGRFTYVACLIRPEESNGKLEQAVNGSAAQEEEDE